MLRTKITSVISLPSCPPNFCSSDSTSPQPSPFWEGVGHGLSGTLSLSRKGRGKSTSRFTLHPSLKKQAAFTLAEGATHVVHFDDIRRAAFTLAEVLITLGIIGVVAALTIPTLINKYREKQTVTAVKTAYSIFSQAYMSVANEYYSLDSLVDSSKSDKENAQAMFNALSKYIKKVKSCDTESNCMGDAYKTLDGRILSRSWDDYANVETGILANGMSFWVLSTKGAYDGYSGQIGVDINGSKRPNQLGVDCFHFAVFKNGVVVASGADNPKYNEYLDTAGVPRRFGRCSINSDANEYNGYACTSWIIEHENMEYLDRDISRE